MGQVSGADIRVAPHIRSHRAPYSCFPKKMSLQLSSEKSVGDVGITRLDWKRIPQSDTSQYAGWSDQAGFLHGDFLSPIGYIEVPTEYFTTTLSASKSTQQ